MDDLSLQGLGTSTAQEAKEYFSELEEHQIDFTYEGKPDDDALELAFSKKKVEERKEWLSKHTVREKPPRLHYHTLHTLSLSSCTHTQTDTHTHPPTLLS
jgi:hypothetical protein